MSLYKSKAVYAASERQYTATGGKFQIPWDGIYEWRKAEWGETIDTQIDKANVVLRELHHSAVTKRELWNIAKLSVFKSVLFWSLPIVMNLGLWLKKYYLKCKQHKWDFCDEYTKWHFATKCAAVKFAEPRMSNHFSESRDPTCIGSAMCPECPTKKRRGKSCWLIPRESDAKVVQVPIGVATFPTFLGPVLVWSQQNDLKLLLTVTYFKSS